MLEYSGDGSSDTGRSGSVGELRPTPYRMIDGSETFELNLRSSFFHLLHGYRSLDSSADRSGSATARGPTPRGLRGSFPERPSRECLPLGVLAEGVIRLRPRWIGVGWSIRANCAGTGRGTLGGTGGCILDIEGGDGSG